jgi:hypothetical protein
LFSGIFNKTKSGNAHNYSALTGFGGNSLHAKKIIMKKKINRRAFISAASIVGAGLSLEFPNILYASGTGSIKPAILGGPQAHPELFPGWPVISQTESKALEDVLQSKSWCRLGSEKVDNFETAYQKLTGAKHALATSCGTSALLTILGALDIGPGDEVIIPVYTFIATYNAVALNYALPVFVDTDIESFQIDANKIEAAITKQTKVLMPVHIGGSPADLDKILDISRKTGIPVIEDACQSLFDQNFQNRCGYLLSLCTGGKNSYLNRPGHFIRFGIY